MDVFPDLTTEAHCRGLLERYPDNGYVKYRLASHLRRQGRHDEASEVGPERPPDFWKCDLEILMYSERIRRRPGNAIAYLNRGIWHHLRGSFGEALGDFDTAIGIDPTLAYAFCARADLRATCPDDSFRDGRRAVEDARTALGLAERAGELIGDWRHRLYLQVLAAAHAESHDFRRAVAIQARALDLALTRRVRSDISQRLERYQVDSPIRDGKGLVTCGYSGHDRSRAGHV